MSRPITDKVRYAVVGAGWFGQAAILPAFANATENSELVAIVSGDAEKRDELASWYGVPAVGYDKYDDLLAGGTVDAVFVATPNTEHRAHALTAARRGVHVLCEKPLAHTAADAEAMTAECDRLGVLLMTAYRLHFEKANLTAVETIRNGTIGEPRIFTAAFTQNVEPGNTRLKPEVGGHPLLDIGIYCLNAARYTFRAEPTEVIGFSAAPADPRFAGVPDLVSAVLRFPGERLASFTCGFGEAKASWYQVVGTKGDIRLDPAFSHTGKRAMTLTVDKDPEFTSFKDVDQIAPEIVYFSECIKTGKRPEPDGTEGVIDLRIMEAILKSIETRAVVTVPPLPAKPRPDMSQHDQKPKGREPELVNAAPPEKK